LKSADATGGKRRDVTAVGIRTQSSNSAAIDACRPDHRWA
jgi:hypothetical protein